MCFYPLLACLGVVCCLGAVEAAEARRASGPPEQVIIIRQQIPNATATLYAVRPQEHSQQSHQHSQVQHPQQQNSQLGQQQQQGTIAYEPPVALAIVGTF